MNKLLNRICKNKVDFCDLLLPGQCFCWNFSKDTYLLFICIPNYFTKWAGIEENLKKWQDKRNVTFNCSSTYLVLIAKPTHTSTFAEAMILDKDFQENLHVIYYKCFFTLQLKHFFTHCIYTVKHQYMTNSVYLQLKLSLYSLKPRVMTSKPLQMGAEAKGQ